MSPKTGRVLVSGSGHLAQRSREGLAAAGYEVVSAPDPTTLEFGTLSAAYLLDDDDEVNLELLITLRSLARTLPVTVALFNEAVASHLGASHPDVRVVNPAAMAAPAFVAALRSPLARTGRATPPAQVRELVPRGRDRLLIALALAFSLLVAAATLYFHRALHLPWVDALYFVVVTVSTVGYGDINLLTAPAGQKLFDIGLIVVSTVFIWLFFSLTVDRIIKQRVERSLGRRRYAARDHVVVCGLGRMGRFVTDALLAEGETVLVVEESDRAPAIEQCRRLGAKVYVGDARVPRVLEDVAVGRAKALFALTSQDFRNVEIGLNARSFNPGLRVILRVFDQAMAPRIGEQFDIHLALSMSAIAAERIVDADDSASGAAVRGGSPGAA